MESKPLALAKPQRVVITAFEEDLARLELPPDGELLVMRSWLPKEAIEGHHLEVTLLGDGMLQFTIDHEATEAARQLSRSLLEQLNKNDPGGDLKL